MFLRSEHSSPFMNDTFIYRYYILLQDVYERMQISLISLIHSRASLSLLRELDIYPFFHKAIEESTVVWYQIRLTLKWAKSGWLIMPTFATHHISLCIQLPAYFTLVTMVISTSPSLNIWRGLFYKANIARPRLSSTLE